MNILGTHYKADGSCVLDAEIDEVERQFLIEYAMTKIIEEYIEELSTKEPSNVASEYRAKTGKNWPRPQNETLEEEGYIFTQ